MESVEYSTSFPPTLLPCRRNQQCFQRFSSREVTLGQVRKIGIQFIIYLLIDTVIPCKKKTHSYWYRDTSFSSHWYRDTSFSLIPWYPHWYRARKNTGPTQNRQDQCRIRRHIMWFVQIKMIKPSFQKCEKNSSRLASHNFCLVQYFCDCGLLLLLWPVGFRYSAAPSLQ